MGRIAGLVVAAGGGRRIGGPEALLRRGDTLLVDEVCGIAHEVGCAPIIVVLGAQANQVRAAARLDGATVVVDRAWGTGLGSSLRVGLEALARAGTDGTSGGTAVGAGMNPRAGTASGADAVPRARTAPDADVVPGASTAPENGGGLGAGAAPDADRGASMSLGADGGTTPDLGGDPGGAPPDAYRGAGIGAGTAPGADAVPRARTAPGADAVPGAGTAPEPGGAPDAGPDLGALPGVGADPDPDADLDAVLVLTVDMPGVTFEAARRVAMLPHPGALVCATYDGMRSYPMLLGRRHWAGLATLAKSDVGARPYLLAHKGEVVDIACDSVADGLRLDKPDVVALYGFTRATGE